MTTTSNCVPVVVTSQLLSLASLGFAPPRAVARRSGSHLDPRRLEQPIRSLELTLSAVTNVSCLSACPYARSPSTIPRRRPPTSSALRRAMPPIAAAPPIELVVVRCRGELSVLVIGQLEVGRRGVGLGLSDRRGARDHDHVGAVEAPGQRHLGRGGARGHRRPGEAPRRDGSIRRRFSGRKAARVRPEPLGDVVGTVASREQALLERAVRDDQTVVLLGPRQDLALDAPVDQVVADLVGEHRGTRRAPRPGATGRARSCSPRRGG